MAGLIRYNTLDSPRRAVGHARRVLRGVELFDARRDGAREKAVTLSPARELAHFWERSPRVPQDGQKLLHLEILSMRDVTERPERSAEIPSRRLPLQRCLHSGAQRHGSIGLGHVRWRSIRRLLRGTVELG